LKKISKRFKRGKEKEIMAEKQVFTLPEDLKKLDLALRMVAQHPEVRAMLQKMLDEYKRTGKIRVPKKKFHTKAQQ
jgi:hypothetical protein